MKLGELIRDWRALNELRGGKGYGIRAVAKQIGISHGTLSRIERGEDMDGATMVKIIKWLFNDMEDK